MAAVYQLLRQGIAGDETRLLRKIDVERWSLGLRHGIEAPNLGSLRGEDQAGALSRAFA